MKKIISLLILNATFLISFAQAPQGFNYQAVARNLTGTVITNQAIGLQINLRQGTSSGTIVYSETHTVTSNNLGLLNLVVGRGTPVIGAFSTINWATGPYFIEISMDVTGGSTYLVMGTQQLMSVPYALFAQNSATTSGNRGNTGATGTTGSNGTMGLTGNTGANGTIGATGAAGTNGSNGITGSTGAAGTNGSNGNTGAAGANGNNGTNGNTGATGAAGTNGANGTTGSTGVAGTNGNNGTTGSTGTAGTNGNNGTTGSTGTAGTNGATGNTGAAGTNGSNGTTGSTGAAGTNGTIGNTGATGAAGTNGSNGTTGSTGAAGTNGAIGNTGATGAAGTNGSIGTTGSTGAAGTNGAIGNTGATGAAGTNGIKGATGSTGNNGVNGNTGSTGAAGTNGNNGTTGSTGAAGTNGNIGNTGATGAAGTNGIKGSTGATGNNGTNGNTGATGAAGNIGTTGSTGASGVIAAGSAAGNTTYWNGSSWVTNSSNIFNNGAFIGIGTTLPFEKLHVAFGNMLLDDNGYMKGNGTPSNNSTEFNMIGNFNRQTIIGDNTNSGNTSGVSIYTPGGTGGVAVENPFNGYSGNSPIAFFGYNKYVGLGTNQPFEKFHVALGNMLLDDLGYLKGNGTPWNNATDFNMIGNSNRQTIIGDNTNSGNTSGVSIYTPGGTGGVAVENPFSGYSGNSPIAFFGYNKYVGLGTNQPFEKFHVALGNMLLDDLGYLKGNGTPWNNATDFNMIGNSNRQTIIGDNTNSGNTSGVSIYTPGGTGGVAVENPFSGYSGNSPIAFFGYNKYVGLGTNQPFEKFHVALGNMLLDDLGYLKGNGTPWNNATDFNMIGNSNKKTIIGDNTNSGNTSGVSIYTPGGTGGVAVENPLSGYSGNSPIAFFGYNKYVGLGTNQPFEKFHVALGNMLLDDLGYLKGNGTPWNNATDFNMIGNSGKKTIIGDNTNSGSTTGVIIYTPGTAGSGVAIENPVGFFTGATPIAFFNFNGNVGIGNSAPNSKLQVSGSMAVAVTNKTAAYTLTASDYCVIYTGTTAVTFTLPVASGCPGRIYVIVNSGTATITTSVAYTLTNGTTTSTLAAPTSLQLISDGTVWRKIN